MVPSLSEIITTTGCSLRSACVTAAFRKLAMASPVEASRTLSRPAETEGRETLTTIPMTAITTSISISVTPLVGQTIAFRGLSPLARARNIDRRHKPIVCPTETPRAGHARPLLAFPTDHIGINSVAAGLAIGAVAGNVRLIAMVAGELVYPIVAPRIFRNLLRHLRAVPLGRVRRLHAQRRQALLGGGKVPVIQLVGAQRAHETLYLRARARDLGFVHVAPGPRPDQGHKQPDDRHHYQHFDQGDARLAPLPPL